MRSVRSGRLLGVHLNQLVATQAAAVMILLGAAGGDLALAAAVGGAAGLCALTWVRVRDRWAFQWLTLLIAFAGRRSQRAPDLANLDQVELIELIEPDTLPRVETLLQAGVRLQLVLSGIPAPMPHAGPAAISYRALSGEDSLAHCRAILAIRALTADDEDLRRALRTATRKVMRKLGASAAGPLDQTTRVRVIADLMSAGADTAVHESWTSLTTGGLTQAVFSCCPEPGSGISARLLSRLLHLPSAVTTLALTVDPDRTTTLLVRLAATGSPDLETSARALHRLLASERITARRLDGEHLPGLAATLPLAIRPAGAEPYGSGPDLPALQHGLMLGRSRQGAPVLVRPFRPVHSTMVLIGSARCAQMITFRALAVGARVLVSTTRPGAWSPLLHGLTGDESLTLSPGPVRKVPAGSPIRPTLVVLDGVPAAEEEPPPWSATLTVLDDADLALACAADLLLLQPLDPDEAASLGPALGLGESAGLLSRMRPGMVAVVTRAAVRWADLAPTSVEKVLIGHPARGRMSDKSRSEGFRG